jgi:bifunctional UDP-N-acetylglucosamine pyrophosphorylase / glucosamine-1-phosphate N-acetyltransferase
MRIMTTPAPLEVVVLAAGQGRRMASRRPKVLHEVAGRPMLVRVVETVANLQPRAVHIVVGHQAGMVRSETAHAVADLTGGAATWVLQEAQRGTGHAVLQALPGIDSGSVVLVVYGDVPLVTAGTLAACVAAAARGSLGVVTAVLDEPAELGRIVRGPGGAVEGIVEYRDADDAQRQIREINSGIMALRADALQDYLAAVRPQNAQGEYYLTDIVALAVADGRAVEALPAATAEEILGVNDRAQLAQLERIWQRRAAGVLLAGGVSMADPARVDIRGTVTTGQDCFLDVNVILEGHVQLGNDVHVGPGVVIRDAVLGDGVRVEAHTVIEGAEISAACTIGPFARVRPGTRLGNGVRIGNFVETKKAVMGPGSKANHLAYLGDATIGDDCNIGAGTVTCNYDGSNKHPTTIGDRVFVGTNSTLVAPLRIESDAFVAAGSTVTTTVAAGDLAVGRSRQRNIHGWIRPDRRDRKPEDRG